MRNKVEIKIKHNWISPVIVLLAFFLFTLIPNLRADEAATDQGSGGRWSNLGSKLKSAMPKIQNPLSELGSEDAGSKPRITPHLHANSGYTSNATLKRKAQSAWIANVSPGVSLDLPLSDKLYSSLGYTYTLSETQGKNIHAHSNGHTLEATLKYDLSKDTSFGARNGLYWSELAGSPGNNYLMEAASAGVKHNFGSRLTGGANYNYEHFRDVTVTNALTPNDTYDDNGATADASYKITDDLAVSPTFAWNIRRFEKVEQKNFWQIAPGVGTEYQLGTKTKIGGNFGWGYRSFSQGDGYESELLYGAWLSHLLSRKINWSIKYDKTLQDTFDSRYAKIKSGATTDLDNFDRRFRVVKNHRLSTELGYSINEKNSISTYGAFQFTKADANDNVFTNDENEEQKMSIGIGYNYRLTRYLTFTLGYDFSRNFQTQNNNPFSERYTAHQINAGAGLSF